MKNKELAKQEYLEMIAKSWTWAKLTKQEQDKFLELLEHPCSKVVIKGNYEQRWEACGALYHTFLEGLGYDPLHWREDIMSQPTKTTHYELNYKTYGEQVRPLTMTDVMQARRLAHTAKLDHRNTEVTLTQVDIITSRIEVR